MPHAATDQQQPRRMACAQCGTAFDCRPGGGCWCAEEDFRLPMPSADRDADCLCPTCLRARAAGLAQTAARR